MMPGLCRSIPNQRTITANGFTCANTNRITTARLHGLKVGCRRSRFFEPAVGFEVSLSSPVQHYSHGMEERDFPWGVASCRWPRRSGAVGLFGRNRSGTADGLSDPGTPDCPGESDLDRTLGTSDGNRVF